MGRPWIKTLKAKIREIQGIGQGRVFIINLTSVAAGGRRTRGWLSAGPVGNIGGKFIIARISQPEIFFLPKATLKNYKQLERKFWLNVYLEMIKATI
jgi:hypothetical protein